MHFDLLASTAAKVEAAGRSVSCAIVQYNLTPTSQYPTQISQSVEALHYLINILGKGPSEVILAGDSAGGLLVMGVLSHLLHPHAEIKRVELPSPLKGVILLSPWVDFEMNSPSALENRMQDPASAPVLRGWIEAYLGGAPLDNYNQPGLAPAEWWNGIPVKQILIIGGAKEVFAEEIAKFGEKVKVSFFRPSHFNRNGKTC
jgi:acetyl esterase/lipase